MTRFLERERAKSLRAEGKSYSEIKAILGVSKSTLSEWLHDQPLSDKRMRELRDSNPRRIENFRRTMQKKREFRLQTAYEQAKYDIGPLSKRDLSIAGFYLYWGEGIKAQRGTIGVANTDPAIIRAVLKWMGSFGIDKKAIRVRLHLYSDMNEKKETAYWSKMLEIGTDKFRKPYIKKSALTGLTYKSGHGHGTCNLIVGNVPMWEYITMALKYLREQHMRP
ncbi:MAG: helix-turn-helix domain-containing protein [Candidatus Kaiserbacteria bacterium]|nr:MAG: helix-turn-helix domain-containing protein [Candidatus Kaiserbacteria bacterium]